MVIALAAVVVPVIFSFPLIKTAPRIAGWQKSPGRQSRAVSRKMPAYLNKPLFVEQLEQR